MPRYRPAACLLVALLLPSAVLACPAPEPSGSTHVRLAGEHSVITGRAEFDRWIQACPKLLAPLGTAARERFLEHLEFNENGVTVFPGAELADALTSEEISVISARLGIKGNFAGLTAAEAERLRAQPRPARASAIELKYDRFVRKMMRLELEGEDASIGAALAELHRSLFGRELEQPGELDGHDLGLLFRATAATAFHQGDDSLLETAAALHGELSHRGLATRARSLDMMRLLLGAGQLDRARALANTNPALPSLPSTRADASNPSGPAVWDLEAEADLLVERQIGLSPFHVVAHVSLGCAFSRAAMEAIGDDPGLGPLFRDHGTWMASTRELTGYARLREWNRTHPATPISVMTSPARWPMLDELAGVPAFYIFRDGELMDTVTGWPLDEGNREVLLAALERAGIAP